MHMTFYFVTQNIVYSRTIIHMIVMFIDSYNIRVQFRRVFRYIVHITNYAILQLDPVNIPNFRVCSHGFIF